ncbi:unnamed protein product [Acanthosepion pharaonis]|uniref:Uncharacterized protein n=1 Tax=Acanthosepion pharaonis TaxID=158019 RepID=A0A812CJ60_ACAPH|nr:unnamed protein product [Sepia pharaonis]
MPTPAFSFSFLTLFQCLHLLFNCSFVVDVIPFILLSDLYAFFVGLSFFFSTFLISFFYSIILLFLFYFPSFVLFDSFDIYFYFFLYFVFVFLVHYDPFLIHNSVLPFLPPPSLSLVYFLLFSPYIAFFSVLICIFLLLPSNVLLFFLFIASPSSFLDFFFLYLFLDLVCLLHSSSFVSFFFLLSLYILLYSLFFLSSFVDFLFVPSFIFTSFFHSCVFLPLFSLSFVFLSSFFLLFGFLSSIPTFCFIISCSVSPFLNCSFYFLFLSCVQILILFSSFFLYVSLLCPCIHISTSFFLSVYISEMKY